MARPDLGRWRRDRLDALTSTHPVFVMIQSLHKAGVNSKALEMAGISDTSPFPGDGLGFERDANGRLSGRLEEQPAVLPFVRFFLQSADALRDALTEQSARYRQVGITSIGVPGLFLGWAQLPLFSGVKSSLATPVRTTAYMRHEMVDLLPSTPRDGERYHVRGTKIWYDESPYVGTMLLDEPYLDATLRRCTLGIAPGLVHPAIRLRRADFAHGPWIAVHSQVGSQAM